MTDYSITLPQKAEVHRPNLHNDEHADIVEKNMELALSAFDVDGKKGLSSDELLQAFDYFASKAKTLKNSNSVITSKDIDQLIKDDSKFSAIREELNNDNKVVELLSNVIMTLSVLVSKLTDYKATRICSKAIESFTKNYSGIIVFPSDKNVKNTQTQIKEVDGKKVQICWNEESECFVRSADGKYRYTNPDYVAKCLGYQKESTWFGLGADKYYENQTKSYSPWLKEKYKLYKVWDENINAFKNGERADVEQIHIRGNF